MEKMSRQTEERLIGALNRIVDHVDGGATPNAAIIRVAKEANFGPGHVGLLVTAYNNAKMNQQRQTGADIWEKMAEFPLANTAEVVSALFPPKAAIKTAAQLRHSTEVSAEYLKSGSVLARRRREALQEVEARQKSASNLGYCDGIRKAAALPTDAPVKQVIASRSRVEGLEKSASDARLAASAAFQRVIDTAQWFADYFRKEGSPSFGDVAENLVVMHGDSAELVLNRLKEAFPILARQGKTKSGYDKAYGEPYELFDKLKTFTAEYAELRQKAAAATGLAEAERAARQPAPLHEPAPLDGDVDALFKSAAAAGAGAAAGTAAAVAKPLADGLISVLGFDKDKAVNKQLRALTSPEHESKLRGIRNQAMLHDLMLNDPVVSGYDPEEVVSAFNDIAEAAPLAADSRALLQTSLRQRLGQESLDAFQLNQLYDIERKIHQMRRPASGGGEDLLL